MSKRTNAFLFLAVTMLLPHAAVAQSWTQLATTGGNPGRAMNGSPGVYDPGSDRLIFFGGTNPSGKNENDVWVLVNANGLSGASHWLRLIQNGTAGSPPARSGHSTVYDQANNRLIVFGGCSGNCVPALNDVWVLSNANGLGGTPAWTQLTPNSAAPTARANASAAYDPARNWLMIFGGQDGSADPCATFSDIWVLTNANGSGGTPVWSSSTNVGNTPPAGNGAAAVYDPVTGVLTSFGGVSNVKGNCTANSGVWTLNTLPSPFLNTWQVETPNGVPPSNRSFASAVYDSVGGRMLLFGGVDNHGNYLDDVWTLSTATGLGTPQWAIMNPKNAAPPGRSTQIATYDATGRRLTIFGGSNASGVLNDVWVLSAPGVAGMSCRTAPTNPAAANTAGLTELMADVVISCTGGTPTPASEPIPQYTVTLSLNTNVTSRLEGTASEALLIVDNAFPQNPVPSSAQSAPSTPKQIVCQPIGSTCTEQGTGGTPSPYQTQANVFAGTVTSANTLQWTVPIDPPGVNNTRVIRLTNVLANVSMLGTPTLAKPKSVQASVSIQTSSSKVVPLSNSSQVVGISILSTPTGVTSTGAMRQCQPHNGVLLGKSGIAGFDFTVQVQENFINQFEYRNYGTTLSGPEFPPALVEQNVPGFTYLTESGFYSPSLFAPAPTLGLADSGMRILVSVSPLSADMQLFVPTTIMLTGDYPENTLAGELQLVQANSNGKSAAGYEPVSATATIGTTPVAEATISGTIAYAVYEVVYADPTIQESASIPMAVAYIKTPTPGPVSATTSLAPVGIGTTASPTAPVPRYLGLSPAQTAFTVSKCP